jgi:CRISPR-associated protein Cmr2
MRYLTLFTIGPVQGFIAQARKLQDLYSGSYLLSYLSKMTMQKAKEMGALILFPNTEQFTLTQQESAPNRFLMKLDKDTPAQLSEFCSSLEAYLRQVWRDIAKEILKNTKLKCSHDVQVQIDSLLQVYYASENYLAGEKFNVCYQNVMQRIGSAKILRGFQQMDEPAGRKCNLMYEYNALFYRKSKKFLTKSAQQVKGRQDFSLEKYIDENETLGAIAFVKRCLRFAISEFNDSYPSVFDIYEMYGDKLYLNEKEPKTEAEKIEAASDKHGYYAMVMFDGDDMGKWYSKPDDNGVKQEEIERFQVYLSSKISDFATVDTRSIVNWSERKNGVVIYAGGEDFLGALNIRKIFSTLQELHKKFCMIDLSEYTNQKVNLTFSAGIVIAHVKTPLPLVLELAREAEKQAKTHEGKDAFCLTIARRSGEMTRFVQPFQFNEKNSLEIFDRLVEIIIKEDLSVKFIYQLSEELQYIVESSSFALLSEIFMIEAERIIRHSEIGKQDKLERIVIEAMNILKDLLEISDSNINNLLMYLRSIAFIARERGAVI